MVCLVIFEPTFGQSLKKMAFPRISFLGTILQRTDFSYSGTNANSFFKKNINRQLFLKPASIINEEKNDSLVFRSKQIKPLLKLVENRKRILFVSEFDSDSFAPQRKEPTIVFYPPLPYSFLLYFQDRQIAHMEFMFYISDSGKVASVKRKISSGNLDVDLLALRYIGHCLNLVKGKFSPGTWQTVNIDLTRKND